jgi:hypothetical protein
MFLKILEITFGKLIGKVPEEKKKKLWGGLIMVLDHAVESGAKGLSEGAVAGMKEKHGDPNRA